MNRRTLLFYGFLNLLCLTGAALLLLPRSARAVLLVAACAAVVLTLAGCGGGGDDAPARCQRKFATLANGTRVAADDCTAPKLDCHATPGACT